MCGCGGSRTNGAVAVPAVSASVDPRVEAMRQAVIAVIARLERRGLLEPQEAQALTHSLTHSLTR